jgi:hypothetical protein
MRTLLTIAVLALSTAGTASAQNGFDGIVRSLETEYGAQRMKIPLLGLARFVVNVSRPHGVSGFDVAVFEDLHLRPTVRRRFFDTVRHGAGHDWQPMIRVRSLSSGEETAIFARGSGKRMNMLVANYEPGEAVVVRLKLDSQTFSRWLDEPARMGDRATNGSEE